MKICDLCRGDVTVEATTTHMVDAFEDGECIIVIRNTPCVNCCLCGEPFFTEEVTKNLEKMVEQLKKIVIVIAIFDYNKLLENLLK